MKDESATAYWLANQARSPIGRKIPKTESRAFRKRQAAVKFVMEELGRPQQNNAWIVTASGLRFDFDIIKQMYTPGDD
jgi:hypothetical protein